LAQHVKVERSGDAPGCDAVAGCGGSAATVIGCCTGPSRGRAANQSARRTNRARRPGAPAPLATTPPPRWAPFPRPATTPPPRRAPFPRRPRPGPPSPGRQPAATLATRAPSC